MPSLQIWFNPRPCQHYCGNHPAGTVAQLFIIVIFFYKRQILIRRERRNIPKYFIKEIYDIARSDGKGYVDCMYMNPVKKTIHGKRAYIERTGNYIVATGAYLEN